MNIFLPIRKCAINIYEIVVDLPPFFIILTCEIETGAGKRPKTSFSLSILAEKSEINPLILILFKDPALFSKNPDSYTDPGRSFTIKSLKKGKFDKNVTYSCIGFGLEQLVKSD